MQRVFPGQSFDNLHACDWQTPVQQCNTINQYNIIDTHRLIDCCMVNTWWIIGLSAWFQSDKDKTCRRNHAYREMQANNATFQASFWVLWSCPISMSCVSKDRKVVQSVSQCISRQQSDPWSDHRTSKRWIDDLGILITLTRHKLACPLCRRRILFMWSISL